MSSQSKSVNWAQDQPAPKHAIRILQVNFPQVRNLGIYNCRNVKGTEKRSSHAQGRALDVGLSVDRPGEKFLGDQLFGLLIKSASRSGIDNVIWNRQIWSASHGGPRPFIGNYPSGAAKDPHTNHIHIEWTRDGSQIHRLEFLELQINILRGGIEDLQAAQRSLA